MGKHKKKKNIHTELPGSTKKLFKETYSHFYTKFTKKKPLAVKIQCLKIAIIKYLDKVAPLMTETSLTSSTHCTLHLALPCLFPSKNCIYVEGSQSFPKVNQTYQVNETCPCS